MQTVKEKNLGLFIFEGVAIPPTAEAEGFLATNCIVKPKLTLSERVFRCESCGAEMDRDLNAAKNLYTLGLGGIYACGHRVRPVGIGAVMDEAGTKPVEHFSTL